MESFRGEIELSIELVPGGFVSHGAVRVSRDSSGKAIELHVTELPVGEFIDDFVKRVHERLWIGGGNQGGFVKTLENNSTPTLVDILIACDTALSDSEIVAKLGLARRFSLTNQVLHDAEGKLRRFDDPREIIEAHARQRLQCYERRRINLLTRLGAVIGEKTEQLRFVKLVAEGRVCLIKASSALRSDLVELGFSELKPGYSHLLSLPVSDLTSDRAQALQQQLAQLEAEHAELEATTPPQMWERDLVALEAAASKDEHAAEAVRPKLVPSHERRA